MHWKHNDIYKKVSQTLDDQEKIFGLKRKTLLMLLTPLHLHLKTNDRRVYNFGSHHSQKTQIL